MENRKKGAAAVSAVMCYLKTEEEAMGMQAGAAAAAAPARQPAPPVSAWSAGGRQSQMHLRNLMQLRTFHGSKHR